ncbi:conserved hypothetical protein [Theileria equi strain WA]|uniref:Uncharacterized protein n=1 Tax=Theileria equi strain WA TaxID=1537102 RepID=L1LD92_THEEQ|nr:conserved hypothetical protein [Theileria equi strain WA]EKX73296.1 conserved hypothetical protein [Theileria equi strain WA]|eukprot:XP_004832748.1 conserved hypothetical protein [Theileria equi strain WA]
MTENTAENMTEEKKEGKKPLDSQTLVRRAGMFMVGLTLLQTLYLGLNASRYTIKRFKIPDESVDLFITKVNNSLQISCFIGTILVNIYFWTCDSLQKYNYKISVVTNFLCFAAYLPLLHSFTSGGPQGHLTYYYYMITFSSFIYGVNQAFMLKVGVSEITYYSASIPLGGLEAAGFHLIFLSIAERINVSNIDHSIVVGQILLSIVMSFITFLLCACGYWSGPTPSTGAQNQSASENTSGHNSNESTQQSGQHAGQPPLKDMFKAWSPILMTALGLGIIYGIYPAIMPFKLARLESAYRLDLIFMISSAFPGIILCIISECTTWGPNHNWKNVNWNYTWFLAIPFVILPVIFILPLHYPYLSISMLIRNNIWFHGFLGFIYLYCHLILVTVGYSAAGTQVDFDKQYYDGNASAFNTLFAYFWLITISLIGHGYLKTYSKYEKDPDNWPTRHYGFWKSLWFWIPKALGGACTSLWATFSADVRGDILCKKEHLFIVYEDAPPDYE